MKQFLFLITIFLASFSYTKAQPGNKQNRADKIQALKIAFITQKLEFTSDEAQRFWPVYNRYEADLKQALIDKRTGDVLENEEKVLNVKKRYRSEFIKVIGQPKTNSLFNAEKEFRGVLMRRLKNKQAYKPNNSLR
jgi:hypothetical protein